MARWTNEQQQAIDKRGSNIIVSAGAGSGKTAVLSERILKIVRDDKKSVRNLIVLTFTKAAALEMKTRIYSKLVSNNLLEEASLVYSSDITTFDAFSLKIVKKYYYLLGLSKDITVCEDDIVNDKVVDIINNIFLEYYNTNNKEFISLLKHQGLKDDKMLVGLFVDLHRRLSLLPDTNYYLDNYIDNNFSEIFINNIVNEFNNYVMSIINKLQYLLADMLPLYSEYKIYKDIDAMYNILNNMNSFNDLITLKNLNANGVPKGNDREEFKYTNDTFVKPLITELNNLKNKYINLVEVKQQLLNSKDDIKVIIDVQKRIEDEIFAYKKQYGAFTFNDIAKMAIKIVNFADINREFKNNIYEILVDEYQDTSDLQEAFLSSIANDNLYMVGDIKQSIYRFRNANPYIFKNKYDNYSNNIGGIKIDLLKNFRSRNEVLYDINMIFNNIMTDKIGDAKYQEEHQMNFGLIKYNEEKDNISYHLEDYIYEKKDEETEIKLSDDEIEAFISAKIVKDNLNNKVFDKDRNTLRKVRFSDYAVIIDRATSFSLYKKIFEYNQIPLEIIGDTNIKESTFLLSILDLLDTYKCYLLGYHKYNKDSNEYKEYKTSLCGLLRSFIFEFSDELIFKIINNEVEFDICNRFNSINSDLSSTDIFMALLLEFNVYYKLPIIGSVDSSLVEVNTIYDKLSAYNDLGYSYIESIDLLLGIINSSKDIKVCPDKDNIDAVKIMTIHKSKGLEYPYCIFTGLSKGFNREDAKKTFGVNDDYGIFIKSIINNSLENNIIQFLNKKDVVNKDLSEKIRLFYVALTRAREKMFLVRPVGKLKNDIEDTISLNEIYDIAIKDNNIGTIINILPNELESKYGVNPNYNKKNKELHINSENKKIIYNNIDFRSKILYKQDISHKVNAILTQQEKDNLEYGSKLHEILEGLDFNNLNLDNVNKKYHNKINNLLKLDIFKDISRATIYQEHEFYYSTETKSYNGIIDLLIEHEDSFIIVDYKTNDIDNEAYYEQLKVYYEYVKHNTNKKIKVYLLSIVKEEYKELVYD